MYALSLAYHYVLDVVRVGGGSKSEEVKKCLIKHHREKTPRALSKMFGQLMWHKESIQVIVTCYHGVVGERTTR